MIACCRCGDHDAEICDYCADELAARIEALEAALAALLGWANIQDHHSIQAVQVRDAARAALRGHGRGGNG